MIIGQDDEDDRFAKPFAGSRARKNWRIDDDPSSSFCEPCAGVYSLIAPADRTAA